MLFRSTVSHDVTSSSEPAQPSSDEREDQQTAAIKSAESGLIDESDKEDSDSGKSLSILHCTFGTHGCCDLN